MSINNEPEFHIIKRTTAKLAERYGIAEMYVYGSVAHGDARPDSDVDLLYRLHPGVSHSALTLQRLTDEMESALRRTVSLTSYDSLLRNAQRSRASKRFLDHIAADMIRVI